MPKLIDENRKLTTFGFILAYLYGITLTLIGTLSFNQSTQIQEMAGTILGLGFGVPGLWSAMNMCRNKPFTVQNAFSASGFLAIIFTTVNAFIFAACAAQAI
jgi:uncharacterized membrane protein YsdA (DUF1294 family)